MQIAAAKNLAELLIQQYPDLTGWAFRLNPRLRRTLGRCYYSLRVIELATAFVQMNDERLIVEGVKHEMAHALVGPGQGHGPTWRRMARTVGCQPRPCAMYVLMPPAHWVAVCPKCSLIYPMFRQPKAGLARWCKRCGPINGILNFSPNQDVKTVSTDGPTSQ